MLLNIIELNTKYYDKRYSKIKRIIKKIRWYNKNKYIQRIICFNKLKTILYKYI